mmetsp:Transcript_37166/g.119229  ORF Transcript_37166/g.119229 Transcript_37166/m.119229 type:complete len:209 (+) Transcript_37166:106-732(+)|eukprot:CAMPEP_0118899666 /NCGR_PEP_ID=MMETSP1166-20130328/6124_1 /TAXON_ID=1104430 /ORGANISM="Chrysoreinhardia sp, Strain CCMP3193" /LENGTH=208 /DNA_ID=CAMNT_0006838797 /DNA_START=75 /DNA_END=701 /DNA_ORIENTATION=+
MAFSLVAAMTESCFRRPELNVVIVGLDNAGKTAILERLKGAFGGPSKKKAVFSLEKLQATMGMNLAKLDLCGCRVMFWDLGGGPKVRDLWERYYGDAHGVVFVVDASDPDRLPEAARAFASACDHHDLFDVPCLVVANKQDKGAVLESDVARSFDLDAKRTHRTIIIRAASALTMDGITDGILTLVDVAKHHDIELHNRTNSDRSSDD